MKYFLRELFIGPFEDGDYYGYILGGLMWLILVILVSGFVWLSVWLIDISFLSIEHKKGMITKKYIIPAHSSTSLMPGKVMVPITIDYDTTYNVNITIDGISDEFNLDKVCWNSLSNNQSVECEYTKGRLFNSLDIKSIK